MLHDVIVVGAGAAGMMAAVQAGGRGAATVLLEKNPRPGLKILISGGGRCNLTTTRSGAALEQEYGGRRGRFLRHALRAFTPTDLRAMIEAQGVPLQEEDLDKVFPVSQRARDVLDALVRMVVATGVDLRLSAPMDAVHHDGEIFVVRAGGAELRARSLILGTGGLSYPKTGSTGDGYAVAAQFGHSIVPCVPHLAALWIEEEWLRQLSGIVLNESCLGIARRGGRVAQRRRRPILFTHKGLSGPAAMDLSGFVEEHGGDCDVVFDLMPDLDTSELERDLQARLATDGRRAVWQLLPDVLPERLRRTLARLAAAEPTLAELSRVARRRLLHMLRELRVPVERSLGMGHAEVTRGGVALEEVEARTMQSRLQPGLFFCGEILDVDGPIGGFNFQAAFATGRLAGLHA